jgi:hypothetical protein
MCAVAFFAFVFTPLRRGKWFRASFLVGLFASSAAYATGAIRYDYDADLRVITIESTGMIPRKIVAKWDTKNRFVAEGEAAQRVERTQQIGDIIVKTIVTISPPAGTMSQGGGDAHAHVQVYLGNIRRIDAQMNFTGTDAYLQKIEISEDFDMDIQALTWPAALIDIPEGYRAFYDCGAGCAADASHLSHMVLDDEVLGELAQKQRNILRHDLGCGPDKRK